MALLDVLSLVRAVWLVLKRAVPIGLMTFALVVATDRLYRIDPKLTQIKKYGSVDHLVIYEQLQHAESAGPVDIAFMGDSSCLMGIHVPTLRERLPGRSIESFCTILTLGPAGYADILEKMVKRGAVPKTLVLVFHPDQFERHPSWDGWVPFVVSDGKLAVPDPPFPMAGLDLARFDWLSILHRPLPGTWGLYYGSAAEFVSDIRTSGGSAVDPGGLGHLRMGSLAVAEEYFRQNLYRIRPLPPPQAYVLNDVFRTALKPLAAALSRLDRRSIYVVISPVFPNTVRDTSRQERDNAARELAASLGLDVENVLSTPMYLPTWYFSTSTHLSRWGRVPFTEILAEHLESKFHVAAASGADR